eukprot:GFUD01010407.1.p1 GENE.GFUD01010407.1~~GFUD01010407.1.p1  ORF type:complete len:364 (+),score=77.11 GFUD01010407.1:78-1169(+)
MMGCCCCGVKTSTVLICTLYLLIHAATLVITILFMTNPAEYLAKFLDLVDTEDERLRSSYFYSNVEPYILQNSGEYFAIPLTVILVLMVSNLLAALGALYRHPILLLPWLALYFVFILFTASLLIYILILLQDIWFQVLLFLVIAPMLVIGAAFWLVVLRLYRSSRHSNQKGVLPPPHSLPPTMYTPEPHSWDQPLPIWAVTPPQNAWDPSFLQQIDPRYVATPEPSTRASRSSRTRSFRSRSRSDGSFRESEESHASSREAGYHQTDSVSLSDKYRQDRNRYEDLSDRERSDGQSEYQTDVQSEYRSENEDQQAPSDVTEDTAESEEEYSEHFQHEVEFVAEEDEQYGMRRIPRPKSRSMLS